MTIIGHGFGIALCVAERPEIGAGSCGVGVSGEPIRSTQIDGVRVKQAGARGRIHSQQYSIDRR